MDIYQKREIIKALGISVEELQKMTSNMDKLNDKDGSIQQSQFDMMKETLGDQSSRGPLGNVVKGIGSLLMMDQMGFNVDGNEKNNLKIKYLKKLVVYLVVEILLVLKLNQQKLNYLKNHH